MNDFGFVAMPVLERVDGRSALEHGVPELAVLELRVAMDGLLEVFSAAEPVALQDVLEPAAPAFDHSVGLGTHRRGEAVLADEIGAEAVELVIAGVSVDCSRCAVWLRS